jgi:hypothetical protein
VSRTGDFPGARRAHRHYLRDSHPEETGRKKKKKKKKKKTAAARAGPEYEPNLSPNTSRARAGAAPDGG